MYNQKIEELIELALADGELTEKEKQVLFTQAEKEGIDLEEFEMVLDAKLHLLKKTSVEPHIQPTKRTNDVHKCPVCGAILPSFATVCEECGAEIRNVSVSNNVVGFTNKLTEINKEIIFPTEGEKESKITFKKILIYFFFFYIVLPIKLIRLLSKQKINLSSSENLKKEFISNFLVPNSKEDLIEFSSLFISKLEPISLSDYLGTDGSRKEFWNSLWMAKIQQLQNKAEIAMKNDNKSLNDLNVLIAKAYMIQNSNNRNKKIFIACDIFALIFIFILFFGGAMFQ